MCSISGFICSAPLRHTLAQRLVQGLLYNGRSRGQQSAGVTLCTTDGLFTFKKAMDPHDFVFDDQFLAFFKDLPASASILGALCHTRQPTCGGRGDEQAQPFVSEQSATVHNGYYHDFPAIKTQFEIDKPSGVDSELVCSYIAKHGITTLPDFITGTDGPSAIAAWNEGRLFLMRTTNPTMTTTLSLADGAHIALFASTGPQIQSAIGFCWLMASQPSTAMTKTGILQELTPAGLVDISTNVVTHTSPQVTWSSNYTPITSDIYELLWHSCPTNHGIRTHYSNGTLCKCSRAEVERINAKEKKKRTVAAAGSVDGLLTLEELMDQMRVAPETLTTDEWTILANHWEMET